jgi:hypothetical protein
MDERLASRVVRAARYSMTWSLDALRVARASPPAPWGGATALRQPYLEATRALTERLTDAGALSRADPSLLVDLARGVARMFRGRRVGGELGGSSISAVLHSITLERRDEDWGGRLELRSVDWDGLELETLSMVASAVMLTPPPNLMLSVVDVELRGAAALEAVIAWVDLKVPEWTLRTDGGVIEAVRRGAATRFVFDALVRDGELEVELRAVRWRRLSLRSPRWLRLNRNIRLPSLPDGMWVAEARHRGADVEFRLSIPTIRRRLDPVRVRDAILRRSDPTR